MMMTMSSPIVGSQFERWSSGKWPLVPPSHQARRKSATRAAWPVSERAIASKRPMASPTSSKETARIAGRRWGSLVDLEGSLWWVGGAAKGKAGDWDQKGVFFEANIDRKSTRLNSSH